MFIADAHLDLAYNASRGRAVELSAKLQKSDEDGIPTVGLPDLRAGQVELVCATIFCEPAHDSRPGYTSADEAHAQLQTQLDWYRRQQDSGSIRINPGLKDHPGLRAILLLEGADPIRDGRDVEDLYSAGLRIIGLAWRRTRYAGGTGQPGPLSQAGVDLVKTLDRLQIIHDASHLAEESFWQLLEISGGSVIASHSNCRAIVPTDRQLSDRMIRAIVSRGGVIGINFFDKFLLPPHEYGKRRATLADVATHVRHICDIAGSAAHVGLGTDMDGGFGQDHIPREIQSSADLPRAAEALSAAGFGDSDVHAIMGENWRRYFDEHLASG